MDSILLCPLILFNFFNFLCLQEHARLDDNVRLIGTWQNAGNLRELRNYNDSIIRQPKFLGNFNGTRKFFLGNRVVWGVEAILRSAKQTLT